MFSFFMAMVMTQAFMLPTCVLEHLGILRHAFPPAVSCEHQNALHVLLIVGEPLFLLSAYSRKPSCKRR